MKNMEKTGPNQLYEERQRTLTNDNPFFDAAGRRYNESIVAEKEEKKWNEILKFMEKHPRVLLKMIPN